MKSTEKPNATTHHDLVELSTDERAQVSGGRQVYLDGMLVEMSDTNIAGLINTGSVRQITVKGVAYPGSQDVDW